MPTRRLDPLSLVFGLLFLSAAGLALSGRSLAVELPWLLAAGATALGIWMVASAFPSRPQEDGEDPA